MPFLRSRRSRSMLVHVDYARSVFGRLEAESYGAETRMLNEEMEDREDQDKSWLAPSFSHVQLGKSCREML